MHIKIEPQNEDDGCMDISNDNDTLYGTYDEKTHCITILVNGDDIATDEAVEEVYCDDHTTETEVSMPSIPLNYSSPYSSSQSLSEATVEAPYSSSQLLNDAIHDVKSPISIASNDCGYESIASPLSYCSEMDELWNSSFNQLFPSLV